jgi:dipeptidyl aminopeptidase/acylaminoacyl peptidase
MFMRAVLLALTLAVCVALPAHAQAPPPVEAFGRLPAIADAAISPDGTRVALAMAPLNGVPFISVFDLDARTIVYTARVEDGVQLRGVRWADDRRVSFLISQTFHPGQVLPDFVRFRGRPRRVDYYRTGVVDLATREMRLLTTNESEPWQDMGSRLIAPIEGDPGFGRMIGRAPDTNRYRPAIYRVDLNSGDARRVTVRGSNTDTIDYVLDGRGQAALRFDSDLATNHWRIFTYDAEEPRLLMEDVSATGAPLDVQGFLPDGRIVARYVDDTAEYARIYAIDRANGARSVLFERQGFEIDDAITDPWTRHVVGATWDEVEQEQHFFDADLQRAYEAAGVAFGENSFAFTSWSRDRTRILLWAEIGLDGGGYYVFTPATSNIDRVSMAYPEIAEFEDGQRLAITYPARDRVRVPAYVTLPPGETRTNLPLVVLVHGGPHQRDTMAYDWWASFLASRGYAVLQPNFRGSSGYGAAWMMAGRGQWGGLMQTDVEDGVAALVRNGMADPNRVCIVGASYGGYAALAGATLTPDRYQCAASIAGVSDLIDFLRQRQVQTGSESASSDHWRISIGDREEDRERIRAVSPANLAERVSIPILLIHGTDDTVVPISQSRVMRDRLERAGKQVRYIELAGDDHWLSDAPTRTRMLRELEAFLGEHIGSPPAQ